MALARSRAASSGQLYRNATYTGITPRVLGLLRRRRPTSAAGCCWAPPTAARASRARAGTSATAPAAPGSATSRWGSASGERRATPAAWTSPSGLLRHGRSTLARRRPRRSSIGTRARLTRFANSEIHQNVAEANTIGQPALRRRAGASGCASRQPPRRRRPARAGRVRGAHRPAAAGSRRGLPSLPGPRAHRARARGLRPWRRRRRRPSPREPPRARSSPPATRRASQAFGSFTDRAASTSRGQLAGHAALSEARTLAQLLTVMMGAAVAARATPRRPRSTAPRSMPRPSAARRPRRRVRRASPVELPAGRLPRRARAVRRRRPARLAGLPGLLGAGGAGGALLLRAGQGHRLAARDASATMRRTWPARPVSFDYEGVPKQRVPLVEAGVCREVGLRRADGGPRRPRVDRPRPAGPEPVRPLPAQHDHGAGGRLARRAGRRP